MNDFSPELKGGRATGGVRCIIHLRHHQAGHEHTQSLKYIHLEPGHTNGNKCIDTKRTHSEHTI